METTIMGYIGLFCIGIMEKKMEIIILVLCKVILFRYNGKENGNYSNGLYRIYF